MRINNIKRNIVENNFMKIVLQESEFSCRNYIYIVSCIIIIFLFREILYFRENISYYLKICQ